MKAEIEEKSEDYADIFSKMNEVVEIGSQRRN
jgi:hypothetical protein